MEWAGHIYFRSLFSLHDFKKCIQSWTGAPCTCSSCIMCFNANVIFKTVICYPVISNFKFYARRMYGHIVIASIHLHPFLVQSLHSISWHTISLSVNSVLYANVFCWLVLPTLNNFLFYSIVGPIYNNTLEVVLTATGPQVWPCSTMRELRLFTV